MSELNSDESAPDAHELIAQRKAKLAELRKADNTQAVLDGDLDQFLEASLKQGL